MHAIADGLRPQLAAGGHGRHSGLEMERSRACGEESYCDEAGLSLHFGFDAGLAWRRCFTEKYIRSLVRWRGVCSARVCNLVRFYAKKRHSATPRLVRG